MTRLVGSEMCIRDRDKIIPKYKCETTLFDKCVLTFILITIALSTTLMLLSLFNPKYFLCS
jgi:hypothetical protein